VVEDPPDVVGLRDRPPIYLLLRDAPDTIITDTGSGVDPYNVLENTFEPKRIDEFPEYWLFRATFIYGFPIQNLYI